MAISWATNVSTATPVVTYGVKGPNENKTSGSTTEYFGMYLHNVVIGPLEPSTSYLYTVGDAQTGQSNPRRFVSAPAVGDDKRFRVAVYGDMGVTNSANTHDRLTGYQDIWNQWMEEMEEIMSEKPYMVGPGNHEASCHSVGNLFCDHKFENFSAYNARFRMPSEESNAHAQNMWYSFDYAGAHFVMMDTETDYPEGLSAPEQNWLFAAGGFGDQKAWLEEDLAAASKNRHNTPWIIVGGHRPMYTTERTGLEKLIWQNVTGQLRAFVEDMFHEYNVDLYLCGHVHAYERILPVYRNQTEHSYNNPTGLPQMVVGAPGNMEGFSAAMPEPTPEWLATRNYKDFGFGYLTVYNSTHLSWEYLSSATGEVLDSFVLVKDH